MKGVLLKDLYIAKSNILVTIVSLIILGFGLSFLVETSALLVLAPVASTTAVFIIPVKSNILLTFNIVLVISVVWFFISYRIATAVYQNRDIV